MKLTKQLKSAIITHAKAVYPSECCGLVINGTYHPCNNIAPNPVDTFEIDPVQFIELSALGDIQAIVHSHPNGNAEPSEVDKVQMGLHGVDWLICAYGVHADGQEYFDIKCHKPTIYTTPLLGREYHHGTQDCYGIVQDYYDRELNIILPDFQRVDEWWEDKDHEPLYENNFKKARFEVVTGTPQKHDVILCRVGRTHHVNHALIFIGDGKLQSETTPDCVGDCLVLHHPHGRLSVREIYGESWHKRTAMIVRHKELMNEND
ncbi:C40 family peptidase [Moraxella sp. VT-16-12]|uniref:C40 family peptidase n=1 Tax=Moraxella sp. VT-16-12 TaxID=2014877 RepID=UPI0011B60B37|nr:C40 family peptidase [Moraxella sp. VT-16-12]TWV81505.1 phage tail protein [Moraxella sp. VT-16-12]